MQKEHFEIILESVDSKMQLLLEGFSVLDKKIDDVKEQLTERADLTDIKIEALSRRFDSLDKKVDSLDKRVDSLDKKVDSLDKKVDSIASDLRAHRADTEAHKGLYVVREG